MPRYLSITECARYHKVTRAAIHAAIKRGALPAVREGHAWKVAEEDCFAYQPVLDPKAKGSQGAVVRWQGQNRQTEQSGARVIPYTYRGSPPSNEDLLNQLKIRGGDYTIITATAAQARQREDIAPSHQRENNQVAIAFPKFMRHLLKEKEVQFLTRAEERITRQRAAKIIAQDPKVERILKHDIFAWRDALADLAERGCDLSQNIPPELQEELTSPEVGQVLQKFHQIDKSVLQKTRKVSYEEAARILLETNYQPTRYIIMEGFTFLTPLQQRFIDTSINSGAIVYLLFPYQVTQHFGFAVMQRTYSAYWANKLPISQGSSHQTPCQNGLEQLQQRMFSEEESEIQSFKVEANDNSVTLEVYSHRSREVEVCIGRIKEYLSTGIEPTNIAIVTRNAAEIQALLQEEVDLQELRDSKGRQVRLRIQPRQLLLTPLGRFVLALYEIWQNNQLIINTDQFETILASGWLGADLQKTTEQFITLKAQMFEQCSDRSIWQKNLANLVQLKRNLSWESRIPAACVDENTIVLWDQAINQIERICRKLFSVGERTIGEHVDLLLDELSSFAPEKMLEAEREILEQIEEVLFELSDSSSLRINPDEFGEILNSLVQERIDKTEDEEDRPSDKPESIWITAPEGIDGCQKDIVLYLGVDNQRVPRQYSEPWPFYTPKINEHQEKERYFFLAVIRAAKKHLYLSYAQNDEDGEYRASPYMQEAADLLEQEIFEGKISQQVQEIQEETVASKNLIRARRSRYQLSEIAHFSLCPFRYKLERLDTRARRYRNPFQIQFLVQGVWLNAIFHYLTEGRKSAVGQDNIRTMLIQAKQATQPKMREDFPGLRDLTWKTVEHYVQKQLDFFANEASKFEVSLEHGKATTYTIPLGNRVIQVEVEVPYTCRKGSYFYPVFSGLLREEWLIPGVKPDDQTSEYTEIEGIQLFSTHYHAVQWWQLATSTAFYYESSRNQKNEFASKKQEEYRQQQTILERYIEALEAGHYPKHRGEHCKYCPVQGDCLGLSEEDNGDDNG